MPKIRWTMLLMAALLLTMSACNIGVAPEATQEVTPEAQTTEALPKISEKLTLEDGVPQLKVYDIDTKKVVSTDIESYVEGVLAGEMPGDWPLEALKAQAVLARTFVLKFVDEKNSCYEGADISTDIAEAQAYDAAQVNERIKEAVAETRGQVLSYKGELPYSWFHAHAGEITALAKEALEYQKDEPGYTQVVKSPDSDKAPEDVKSWTAKFTKAQVAKAAEEAGVSVSGANTVEIGAKGKSGRAVTLAIDGTEVSAPALRIHLGSKELKSTLITDIKVEGDQVVFSGHGYGHGVGMSQWGAFGMAESGKDAQQILEHYFKDVSVVDLWK